MKALRLAIVAFAALALMPIVVQAIQTQRSQIGVTIIINVTPNPLAMGMPAPAQGGVVAKAVLRGAPLQIERRFEAQQLHFTSTSSMVAQVQKAVKVEASIAPNPTATLLYSDQNAVVLNAEAGVNAVFPCAYHVTVDTTITSWSLDHGLSNDFSNGSGGSFAGKYVANNSYIATPRPTATPFAVYSTDGGTWNLLQAAGGMQTFCVDLTISMPITTTQGTYSSNAIYTLYY